MGGPFAPPGLGRDAARVAHPVDLASTKELVMWSKVISVLFVVACVGCTGTWEKRASTTLMVSSNATIVCAASRR